MRKRFVAPIATLAAVGAGLLASGVASACHADIVASARCEEVGEPIIDFTSTSYTTGIDGENSQIDILFDGVVVDTGAFTAPNYAFSGSLPAPDGKIAGDTVVVSAVAVANWANGATGGQVQSVTVTIPEECTADPALGRFTGGGHQVRIGDARVTRGLTIHCDLLLSNNLEVNWGGNQFHMTEHLETVACTDDPAIIQNPPPAPLDTLIGVGTGRYNGTDGYTIEFTLRDFGEPGRNDQASLRIYETANSSNVVLNVPLSVLTGGNLQAHYDQPHQ